MCCVRFIFFFIARELSAKISIRLLVLVRFEYNIIYENIVTTAPRCIGFAHSLSAQNVQMYNEMKEKEEEENRARKP